MSSDYIIKNPIPSLDPVVCLRSLGHGSSRVQFVLLFHPFLRSAGRALSLVIKYKESFLI